MDTEDAYRTAETTGKKKRLGLLERLIGGNSQLGSADYLPRQALLLPFTYLSHQPYMEGKKSSSKGLISLKRWQLRR